MTEQIRGSPMTRLPPTVKGCWTVRAGPHPNESDSKWHKTWYYTSDDMETDRTAAKDGILRFHTMRGEAIAYWSALNGPANWAELTFTWY